MLSIYYTSDKVPLEILTSVKFIGGEIDILSICNDLIGDENRLYSAYASLTPAELIFTPAELIARDEVHLYVATVLQ